MWRGAAASTWRRRSWARAVTPSPASSFCSSSAPRSSTAEAPPLRRIDTLLIANRGEISRRIARTCVRESVTPVAIYSPLDGPAAPHCRLLPGASSRALRVPSYLDAEGVLEAAERAGAQAIHPGYGFLSENAEFAELCRQRGVVFVGPPPGAIRAMGSKSASKAIMEAAGVPIVPGYHGSDQSFETFRSHAERIGYPVLVKPVAGGGGKGMYVVRSAHELADALAAAARTADAAFGDPALLIEKYVQRARHVEVQVFADAHGNVVHLFERDCSVQRRHQKVVEEAPAFNPDRSSDPASIAKFERFRADICHAAVEAARAVGYVNAGTVEFIVDCDSGEFYFMEMNTRLQVEHPVTEMVTGVDLVSWQLAVASGQPLPLRQSNIRARGHAVEARVYAEDIPAGFLPAAGRIHAVHWPHRDNIRVEAGVDGGDEVSIHYDPMIAKVVAQGPDRKSAIKTLHSALGDLRIAGPPNNVGFLRRVLAHESFLAGDVDTGFIKQHEGDLLSANNKQDTQRALALAAVAQCLRERESIMSEGPNSSAWACAYGKRLNHNYTRDVYLGDKDFAHVTLEDDDVYSADVNSAKRDIRATLHGDKLRADVDGELCTAHVANFTQQGKAHTVLWVGGDEHHFAVDVSTHAVGVGAAGTNVGTISAPMAGRVVKVMVEKGALVDIGTPLVIIEAMKMEHTMRAPCAGTVESLSAVLGKTVEHGQVLAVIAPQTADSPA